MYYDGFHRSFCDDDDDLEIIQESDSIFAFETPELFRPEQIRSKRCGTTSCLLTLCLSVVGWQKQAKCFIFGKVKQHVGLIFGNTSQGSTWVFSPPTWTFSVYVSGSPHANLNQNNLKYGTDNNRMATQIQEPTTPPQSPNKNSGQAEKIVLLVCNRACAGQQGRRCFNEQSCVRIVNLIHKSSKTCCFSIFPQVR